MRILALIIAVVALLTGGGNVATTTESETYPLTGIITEIDEGNDFVVFECANGNQFSFYGVEDWMVGDVVSAIMDDNGTPEVKDDKIVKIHYSGTTERLEGRCGK